MRPWETEFVFVCEKEIFKRKSRRFSYLRSERHLCMTGVRVAHRGVVREMRSREMEFCVCERERYFTMGVIAKETYEGTQDISRER